MAKEDSNKLNQIPGLAAWLIVFCAVLLELFVFNSQAFALNGRKYTAQTLTADDFSLTGFTVDPADPTWLKPDANVEHAIEIKNIDLEIHTLWLKVTSQGKPVIRFRIDATDDAASHYYKVVEDCRLIAGSTRSQFVRLHLDGSSTKIKIGFELAAGQDLCLQSITLNEPIPLHFSLIRFGILSLLGLLILFLRRSAVCRNKRSPGDPLQRSLLLITILAVILVGVLIAAVAAGGKMTGFKADDGDVYSRDLTNALAAGQFQLLTEPPAALADLENPYDPSQRAYANIRNVLWDVAYFQGHYYIYFGIVPALLLFLPFHLATGLYLPTIWAVILFSAGSLIVLLRLADRLLFHFFPQLPFRFYLVACLALAAGSNLWWCLARPKFYELAITGGLFFGVLGLDLLFRCWQHQQDGRTKFWLLSLGCLSLALAVGTRPNLLLLSLLPIPLFWQCLRRPGRLKALLAIALPYLSIGGALMLYNWLRFDKISEFGASYQLTVTDMGARGMLAPARILPGFWYYLFNFPIINTAFPFIHFQTDRPFNYSGYFYTDEHSVGLLVTLPVCWLLLAWPWLRPALRQTGSALRRMLTLACVVALLIVAVDSMAAGSTGRYLTDFAWLFVLAAILIGAAQVMAASKTLSVFELLCGLTVFISLLLALQGENDLIRANQPVIYYQLERLMAFWLP